jgi:hypothetical protein
MVQSSANGNLPQFDADGNLPPGIHSLTLAEATSLLVFNERRADLFRGFQRVCLPLQQAGCQKVYIGGSFATSKEIPGDFDACWDESNVDLVALESIEPVLFDFRNNRAAQKAKFGGELFPAYLPADQYGTPYLEFFQRDRDLRPKGIVLIYLT